MAGTDRRNTLKMAPSPIIILCEPQLGENIGTAARAMANFGLWQLRLVNPRDGWPNDKARSAAAKADHVIDGVEVFDRLEDALSDVALALATTARHRDMRKDVVGPKVAAQELVSVIGAGQQGALLFGRERWGLNNDEIALSDKIVTLPVDPTFASLNIAQAVLLMAYEWRTASEGDGLPFDANEVPKADKGDLVRMFEHLEASLDASNYFITAEKRPSMVQNLRTMLTRAQMSDQEVRTFRGIISSLDRQHEQARKADKKKGD